MEIFQGLRGVFFDLFNTLLYVDEERLPLLQVGDQRVHSSFPTLSEALIRRFPHLHADQIFSAMAATMAEGRPRETGEYQEIPDRVLFARVLRRLPAMQPLEEVAEMLSDLQMRTIATAACCAKDSALLLDRVRTRGMRTVLVSNLSHARAAPWLLEAIGLQASFDGLVLSEDIGVCKPHPAIFQSALDRFGFAPDQVLHVGDDPLADVWGAGRLGMKTVWLNPRKANWTQPELAPTLVIGSLAELIQQLP